MALTGSNIPQPTSAHLNVNASQIVRTLDGRVYGLNTAVWDANLGTPASVSLLSQMGTQTLRFPGGSSSDGYDWSTGRSDGNSWAWSSSFATFAALAEAARSQAILTVNYGSGTPQMAAAWVAYADGDPAGAQVIGVDAKGRDWKTVGYWASLRAATPLTDDDGENFLRVSHPAPYGVRDWEIGNECYGSWENDQHGASGSGLSGSAHDAYTYAGYAAQFFQAMKAVDPAIKVGVVGIPGEDAWGDGRHPVPNPNEGNTLHSGWTPVVLATLASLGITPDFVVHHRYAPESGRRKRLRACCKAAAPDGRPTPPTCAGCSPTMRVRRAPGSSCWQPRRTPSPTTPASNRSAWSTACSTPTAWAASRRPSSTPVSGGTSATARPPATTTTRPCTAGDCSATTASWRRATGRTPRSTRPTPRSTPPSC